MHSVRLLATGAALLIAPAALVAQADGPLAPAKGREHPRVRVCAGGDVTLGTNVDTSWTEVASWRLHRRVAALPSPDSLLRRLRPLVRGADVVLLNVEGAIGEGEAPPKCTLTSTFCFALRQPIAAAAALRAFGDSAEVVGNLANNHARDAGLDGLDSTIMHLEMAGVHVTGADTLPTVVVTAAGDTIAFLGFSSSGVPDVRDLPAVRRHVSRAAELYPRLVVTMHLGAEGAGAQHVRDTTERYAGAVRGNPVQFADAALESGARLVIGHGPHVLRAMRWRRGGLVAYSLGNLVNYGPFALHPPLDRGAILCASLDERGAVHDVRLRPTRQRRPGIAAPDPRGDAIRIVDALGRSDFPRDGVRLLPNGRVAPRPKARKKKKPARPAALVTRG